MAMPELRARPHWAKYFYEIPGIVPYIHEAWGGNLAKFAAILKRYRISSVIGDAFAGETFRQDFRSHGISYDVASLSTSDLYEAMETQHSVLRQPLHQGKGQQGFEHLIKAEEIRHRLTQRQRPMGSTLCEQFFRDVVWGEKGAEL